MIFLTLIALSSPNIAPPPLPLTQQIIVSNKQQARPRIAPKPAPTISPMQGLQNRIQERVNQRSRDAQSRMKRNTMPSNNSASPANSTNTTPTATPTPTPNSNK